MAGEGEDRRAVGRREQMRLFLPFSPVLNVAGNSIRRFFQKNGTRPQRIETSSRRPSASSRSAETSSAQLRQCSPHRLSNRLVQPGNVLASLSVLFREESTMTSTGRDYHREERIRPELRRANASSCGSPRCWPRWRGSDSNNARAITHRSPFSSDEFASARRRAER